MDSYELQNWLKVKKHLESIGSTDNHFYKRAVRITAGHSDPMAHPPLTVEDPPTS